MIFKICISLYLCVSQVGITTGSKYLVFPQGIHAAEGDHKRKETESQKNPFISGVIVHQEYMDKTQITLGKSEPEAHLDK